MKITAVANTGESIKVVLGTPGQPFTWGFAMGYRDAAILLAGLEVALGKALEDAGHGKCLHCGKVRTTGPCTTRCCYCHGVLTPAGKDGGA